MFHRRPGAARRALLFAALLATGIAAATAAQVIDRVLVVVNEDVITESEFVSALRQAAGEIRATGGQVPSRRELEDTVMERLILERIQLQMADQMNIEIAPEQIDRAIADIASRQGIDVRTLLASVRRAGMNPVEYREDIGRQLRIQRVIDREIRRKVAVSEKEIDDRVKMLQSGGVADEVEYDVALISLPIANAEDDAERERATELARSVLEELRAGADFGALAREYSEGPGAADGGRLGWRGRDQLPDVFNEVLQGLQAGETSGVIDTPGGIHILKLIDRRGGGREVVEQWRVRHILVEENDETTAREARENAERLLQRIEQGEEFAELARVHSADERSRVKGGELGWLGPGDTVPEFEEALRNTDAGAPPIIVDSRFGAHVVEVLERRRRDVGQDMLRQQAERQLREEKGRDAYDQWLRRIREEAYVRFRIKPSGS